MFVNRGLKKQGTSVKTTKKQKPEIENAKETKPWENNLSKQNETNVDKLTSSPPPFQFLFFSTWQRICAKDKAKNPFFFVSPLHSLMEIGMSGIWCKKRRWKRNIRSIDETLFSFLFFYCMPRMVVKTIRCRSVWGSEWQTFENIFLSRVSHLQRTKEKVLKDKCRLEEMVVVVESIWIEG